MINTSIETDGDSIRVTVTLKRRLSTPEFTTLTTCKTADVIKILEEKKIKTGKCAQSTRLCNNRDNTCSGTWVFEKPKRKKPVPKKKIVTAKQDAPIYTKEPISDHKKTTTSKKTFENVDKVLDNS